MPSAELCVIHSKKISEMHEAIYGNSHPQDGLIWIAKENRKMINELQEFVALLKKWSFHVFTFLLLAGISALGSFLIALYKMLIEHQL